MMNAQDFARHTHEQETQRIERRLAEMTRSRNKWHDYALAKSREVGKLTEENQRLCAELDTARKEIARLETMLARKGAKR